MPQADIQTPTRCHICDDYVVPDTNPQRAGWLYCPGCEQPVWMPLAKGWVQLAGTPDIRPILRATIGPGKKSRLASIGK